MDSGLIFKYRYEESYKNLLKRKVIGITSYVFFSNVFVRELCHLNRRMKKKEKMNVDDEIMN
jgi:hypothetical protein